LSLTDLRACRWEDCDRHRLAKQGRIVFLRSSAWVVSGAPGPLRAFFIRIRDKRGKHVAAVATACKLAVVVWHMLTRMRTSPGAVRRSCSGNFGDSSSKPVIRLAAAAIRKDRPPPTVTSQRATASARRPATPRKNTAGSLRTGNSNRQRGARAPQMRCDDHRLRDRAGTSTLLFATWSPERQ